MRLIIRTRLEMENRIERLRESEISMLAALGLSSIRLFDYSCIPSLGLSFAERQMIVLMFTINISETDYYCLRAKIPRVSTSELFIYVYIFFFYF